MKNLLTLTAIRMFSGDKLWYAILDAEAFVVMDQDRRNALPTDYGYARALAIGSIMDCDWSLSILYNAHGMRSKTIFNRLATSSAFGLSST